MKWHPLELIYKITSLTSECASGHCDELYIKKDLCSLRGRRKWQPTPVFLPGEFHGERSLVGCCPWGRTDSDTTEAT